MRRDREVHAFQQPSDTIGKSNADCQSHMHGSSHLTAIRRTTWDTTFAADTSGSTDRITSGRCFRRAPNCARSHSAGPASSKTNRTTDTEGVTLGLCAAERVRAPGGRPRVHHFAGGMVCGTAFGWPLPGGHDRPRERPQAGAPVEPAAAPGGPGRPPVADRLAAADLELHRARAARLHHPLLAQPAATHRPPDLHGHLQQSRYRRHRSPRASSGPSACRTPTPSPRQQLHRPTDLPVVPNLTPNTVNEDHTVHQRRLLRTPVNSSPGSSIRSGPRRDRFVVQGGARTPTGPATAISPDAVRQRERPATGVHRHRSTAMANTGATRHQRHAVLHQDRECRELDQPAYYGYTIFGQLVTGPSTTRDEDGKRPAHDPGTTQSSRIRMTITVDDASRSTNPNGVLILDTHRRRSGRDRDDHGHSDRHGRPHDDSPVLHGTVGAYAGPDRPDDQFQPRSPTRPRRPCREPSRHESQLNGQSGYPDTTTPATLTYSLLSQPSHGTVTNFNASTGTFTYTPNKDYLGTGLVLIHGLEHGPASHSGDHDQQSRAPCRSRSVRSTPVPSEWSARPW